MYRYKKENINVPISKKEEYSIKILCFLTKNGQQTKYMILNRSGIPKRPQTLNPILEHLKKIRFIEITEKTKIKGREGYYCKPTLLGILKGLTQVNYLTKKEYHEIIKEVIPSILKTNKEYFQQILKIYQKLPIENREYFSLLIHDCAKRFILEWEYCWKISKKMDLILNSSSSEEVYKPVTTEGGDFLEVYKPVTEEDILLKITEELVFQLLNEKYKPIIQVMNKRVNQTIDKEIKENQERLIFLKSLGYGL